MQKRGLNQYLLRLSVRRFQIPDQPLKRLLIGVVVFPVAEVGDEILANLAGGIFAGASLSFPVPGSVSHPACRAECGSRELRRYPEDNKSE